MSSQHQWRLDVADFREFSVLLLVFVAICAYLATARVIGGAAFAASIVASAIAVLLIRNMDQVERLMWKTGDDQLLVEMRQIQRDVYAKVEQLQQMAVSLAKFSVAGIVAENRFVNEEHQAAMLHRKDELDAFLKNTGIDESARAQILQPITTWVDWDLRQAIVGNAVSEWKPPSGSDPTDTRSRDELQRQIENTLQQPDRLAALNAVEKILRQHGLESHELSRSFKQYRDYLTAGRLPKVGAADDLTRPPARP